MSFKICFYFNLTIPSSHLHSVPCVPYALSILSSLR